MRVIVTGGTGLIGSALTRSLTADGHEVIVLTRRPAEVDTLPSGARAVGWDGRTSAGWGALVNEADAVVNLAGAGLAGEGLIPSPWTASRRKAILQSRIDAGAAVVEALERADARPAVVIQASAVGYYPTHVDDRDISESAAPADNFLADVCIQWEAATLPVEALGVRRAVIRTSLVLSAAGGNLPLFSLPTRLFVGGPIGSGRQWVPWIHLDDQVRAIRFLLDMPDLAGPFNLVAPHSVRFSDFTRTLARVLGRPYYLPVPGFAVRLVLGELSMIVLEGQKAVPARLVEAGFAFRFGQLEGALRHLYGRPA